MLMKTNSHKRTTQFLLLSLVLGRLHLGASHAWAALPEPSISPSPSPSPVAKRKSLVVDIDALRPQFGIQLFTSPSLIDNKKARQFFTQQGFTGGTDSTGNPTAPTPSISAIGLMLDYQPAFMQFFGVLDLGASIAINPIFPTPNTYVNSILSLYSAGLQARYQLRFFRGQPLVPMIGYYADAFSYSFSGSTALGDSINLSGRTMIHGRIVGAWLLLNWIEPTVAREYFIDSGASRSYLTFEARELLSNGPSFNVSGWSYLFGFRSEF